MKNIILTLLYISVFMGCEKPASISQSNAKLSPEFEHIVEGVNGKCRVTTASMGAVDLEIPFPCTVHTNNDGAVRYIVRDSSRFFVVESSAPDTDFAGDCITYLQALRIDGQIIRASTYSDKVATCPPFDWDEQVFVGMFDD